MPPDQPGWRQHRARLAASVRFGNAEDEARARADLKAWMATDYIKNLVDSWPPMPEEKRRELALILAPELDGP